MSNRVLAWVGAGILLAAGCRVGLPSERDPAVLGLSGLGSVSGSGSGHPGAYAVVGRVIWPEARQALASFIDVARASTVSLIDSVTNQVMATTLTTPELTFVLTIQGFAPELYRTYYLEALKGLGENKASNDAARLRTLMRWTSSSNIQSITVPSLVVSVNTTALSAIANLRSLNPDSFLGRINLGPPEVFDSQGSGLPQEDLAQVAGYVNQALAVGRDPLFAVRHDGTSYVLDLRGVEEPAPIPPPLPYIVSFSRNSASPGDQVTVYGGNFATPAASNSVKIGSQVCAVVSGGPDALVFTVPTGTTSGTLTLVTPVGTASAPFGVVSTLGGNLGGTKVRPTPAPGKDVVGTVIPRLDTGRTGAR